MASTNLPPEAISQPYANNGDKSFPIAASDVGTNAASIEMGIPAVCSEPLDTTGLPVRRTDFNALGYLTTSLNYFMQNGGSFTFDASVSSAIGGYPLGAKLWAEVGGISVLVKSLKNNNEDNFVTTPAYINDGTSWAYAQCSALKAANGYRVDGSGLIFQWASGAAANTESKQTITFPVTNPNTTLQVFVTYSQPEDAANNNGRFELISQTASSADVRAQYTDTVSGTITPHIFVIGY